MTYITIWIVSLIVTTILAVSTGTAIAAFIAVGVIVGVGALMGNAVARKSAFAEAIGLFLKSWWKSVAALVIVVPVGMLAYAVLMHAYNVLAPISYFYLLVCGIGCFVAYHSTWLSLNFGYIVGEYFTKQHIAKMNAKPVVVPFGRPSDRWKVLRNTSLYEAQQSEIALLNAPVDEH